MLLVSTDSDMTSIPFTNIKYITTALVLCAEYFQPFPSKRWTYPKLIIALSLNIRYTQLDDISICHWKKLLNFVKEEHKTILFRCSSTIQRQNTV